MAEQLEKNRKLLALKGVPEEEPEPKTDSTHILEEYRRKRQVSKLDSDKFDDLDLQWNNDGTLNRMVATKNGDVLYQLNFAWNPDGTLSKIMRTNGGEA